MASAVSAAGLLHIPDGDRQMLGDQIPVASYGLPGTKNLRENIKTALSGSRCKAVIMAHHGAVCFGKDSEEAFAVARQLEEACSDYIQSTYLKMSHDTVYEERKFLQHYISVKTGGKAEEQGEPQALYRSRRIPGGFVLTGETGTVYRFEDQMPREAQIHKAIYQKRPDINYISQDTDKSLTAISHAKVPLKPLLDDFAQIIGSHAACSGKLTAESVNKALGRRMGVIIPGCGAICCAASESDLHAVKMVMEKNAAAQIAAQIIGKLETISLSDCKLMHFIYTRSYAKKANIS
jgi:L-fuculose-phosphate aldolase